MFFNQDAMEKSLEELKVLYKENVILIRAKQSFEQNSGKYRKRIKPKITKNHKDAI